MKIAIRAVFLITTMFLSFFLWLRLPALTQEESAPKTEDTPPSKETPQPEEETKKAQMVHIKRSDGSEEEMELETYLLGVVGSEMPASFSLEALKAQAVAARTFVCKRDYEVDDTTASQVYHDDEQLKQIWQGSYEEYAEKIKQAVEETKGEVMTYEGDVITAAFFSSCNGMTNNSEDYWKEALPYLRSVESPWDKEVENTVQSVSFSAEELATTLGFEQPITSISTPIRYDNGYVKSVTMDGIVFSGRELREKLQLRSNAFEIQVSDTITFTTYGYGHAIGMSQIGAQGMAEAGSTYDEILKHYYTGVEIVRRDV